jgi:hypothetical protein
LRDLVDKNLASCLVPPQRFEPEPTDYRGLLKGTYEVGPGKLTPALCLRRINTSAADVSANVV